VTLLTFADANRSDRDLVRGDLDAAALLSFLRLPVARQGA
jgi:hypothetical protein